VNHDDKRAAFIADLRALADLLETNPALPTPTYTSGVWTFLGDQDGTEAERFDKVHDFAEAYGVEVTEDDKRARRAIKRFGAIDFTVHAAADDTLPTSERRVVARPGAQTAGAR
jgi:hypothetical protein